MRISEKDALEKIADLLADWLRVPKNEIRKNNPPHNKKVDGYFKVGNYEFVVEIKSRQQRCSSFLRNSNLEKEPDTISITPCSVSRGTLHGRRWP